MLQSRFKLGFKTNEIIENQRKTKQNKTFSLTSFRDNLGWFKTLWMDLDHSLELLYENMETHYARILLRGLPLSIRYTLIRALYQV